MSFARAANTTRQYDHSWKNFAHWCQESDRQALPATAATLLDFVTCRLEEGHYKLSTIKSELFAVQYKHTSNSLPNPFDAAVRELLRNASRKLRQRPQGKRALTPSHLRSIGDNLKADDSAIAKRDHAMIVLGFAAGWRASELVSLSLSSVWFEQGRIVVQLGASKTDQDGSRGRLVSIPPGQRAGTCPVVAVRSWLEVRGDWQGPLFCRFNCRGELMRKPISGCTLNRRLKQQLSVAGENPGPYGAHSLRAGMMTSAAENGADVTLIMQRSGHTSVQTVMKYIRPVAPFQADPLAGVL